MREGGRRERETMRGVGERGRGGGEREKYK